MAWKNVLTNSSGPPPHDIFFFSFYPHLDIETETLWFIPLWYKDFSLCKIALLKSMYFQIFLTFCNIFIILLLGLTIRTIFSNLEVLFLMRRWVHYLDIKVIHCFNISFNTCFYSGLLLDFQIKMKLALSSAFGTPWSHLNDSSRLVGF